MPKNSRDFMKPFTFHLPTRIFFGDGSLSVVGAQAAALGKKCLFVTGRSFARRSGYLDFVKNQLSGSGLEVAVFDQVESNPSIETTHRGAALARSEACDVVVALGGGSAMDAAKAIAFLALNEVSLEEWFAPNEVTDPALPLIAIPTTCGTGSEVTRYAVLSDPALKKKRVLFGTSLLPRVALLDPNLLELLPNQLVAYTAFDALSHSFEALLSKASNNMSDLFAVESIVRILKSLELAYGGCAERRRELLYGSMLAGMAINSAGTVVVHGMGYYLTNYHGIHHGLANAMLLTHALRFEGDLAWEKLERVLTDLGLRDLQSLFERVEKVADRVEIPNSLSELGIDISELDLMVSDAMSYARNLENNPVTISDADVRELYKRAFEGRRK